MARLQDILSGDLIIEDLQATDKAGVVREFASLLARAGKVRDAGELERVLLERESQCSTGIGDGIAIPHAKSGSISEMVIAFGRSGRGIDYQSLDGRPAHLFFLLVTPDDRPSDHLKTLARISRILRNPVLRTELMRSSARQEIQKLLLDEDSRYPNSR
jgi:fructose-specific phosphotransferase system IIA component